MKNLRPTITLTNGQPGLRAMLAASQVRVLDDNQGIVEYIASDETIDSYREIVRVNGWQFDMMEKNAPFVDTHNYCTITNQLGTVLDWRIDKRLNALVETVKWAKDVKENEAAQFGWAMITAGFGPKAVSVGFMPVSYVTKWDNDPGPWREQLNDLGIHEEDGVRVIYTQQQQIELSACILGANPNALQLAAKAYKAGALDDGQIEFLSRALAQRETATPTASPDTVEEAQRQARQRYVERLQRLAARF
jgi:hypothetical protein